MGTSAQNGTLEVGRIASSAACSVRFNLPSWKVDHRPGKKPQGPWRSFPAGLLEAVSKVAPFASRNDPKFMGVHLNGSHAYASNECVAVEVEVGAPVPQTTIPSALVRLLSRRGLPPCAMLVRGGGIAFAWTDGSWLDFTSNGDLPASVAALFAKWQEPEWWIPSEWKRAFSSVVRLADDTVTIGPDCMTGGRGQAAVEVEATTPVQRETAWSRAVLAPVVKIADRIDFAAWPKPVPFAFENGRGFVAGKQ